MAQQADAQSAIADHYSVLGVSRAADLETIKRQYQRLILQHHPDKANARGDHSGAAAARFQAIQLAWDTLKDPRSRSVYDHQLTNGLLARPHPVNGELDLDDMNYDEATGEYFSDCRCGGQYAVMEDELRSGCDTVVCNQCSLSVRVLFSVDDGDGNTDGHGDGQ